MLELPAVAGCPLVLTLSPAISGHLARELQKIVAGDRASCPMLDNASISTQGHPMRRNAALILISTLAACASSGVVPTGPDTYMLTKTSAGGMFVSGSSVKSDLYVEANRFCASKGLAVDTVDASSKNAIPFARMPSADLHFKCVPPTAQAASAPQ